MRQKLAQLQRECAGNMRFLEPEWRRGTFVDLSKRAGAQDGARREGRRDGLIQGTSSSECRTDRHSDTHRKEKATSD